MRRSETVSILLLAAVGVALVRYGAPAAAEAAGAGDAVYREVPAAVADEAQLVVAGSGNRARYRVRERLMGRDRDNDAVGETGEVSGQLVIAADGALVREGSRLVVLVENLTSDQERRDGYVRRRTLEAEEFPDVVLVPTELRGLHGGLPTSGERRFDLVGDLTVRGVTRPTSWRVTARFGERAVSGTAATAFTFADFALAQPRVPILLSVADTIRLEYDFTLDVERVAAP